MFFQGAEHQAFLLNGGPMAALLVHGFPGTPAEMRTLADVFNQAGWTAQGILLPGFGAEFPTLLDRRYVEWVSAVDAALTHLERNHRQVILVGYSMGGAVSIQVAANHPPSGLVLLAPFWQLGTPVQRLIWHSAKHLARISFFRYPLRNADFTNPNLRRRLTGLIPELDLDHPDIQTTLRAMPFPVRLVDQLLTLGRESYQVAARLALPTLVIQGAQDDVVRPEFTRRLLQRIPGPLEYREFNAAHTLVLPADPAWPHVARAVLDFAQRLVADESS